MNKTRIDWADRSWNPVTGCLHECPYCYARRIAQRFTPSVTDNWDDCTQPGGGLHEIRSKGSNGGPWKYGFAPTLHSYRLGEPARIKKPQTIFVGSMCDLFGKWVPDEWIGAVFDACLAAPQHRYLFLTKNAARYCELYDRKAFPYSENFWFGTTVTSPHEPMVWFKDTPYKAFVSIEPILEPFGDLTSPNLPDWVIIGAETGNRLKRIVPEKAWIESIINNCRRNGLPVFMKDNLRSVWGDRLIQEYPWGDKQGGPRRDG